jgi:type 1 fimbriae regulatory protein FimE
MALTGRIGLMGTNKDAARKPRVKKKVTRQSRDYVLPKEMDRVLKAAVNASHHGHRNYTLILLCYRHGLRVGELVKLRWRMVDFKKKALHVTRLSNGIKSVHPLRGEELVALRKLKREYPGSSYLFMTDRGTKVTESSVRRIVARAGREAGLGVHLHPRMLRHGCGHALADAGHSMLSLQHYLGHKNIQHTLRYMELPPQPFKQFWKN